MDQSSKHLLEINDRLTRQIEDNLALFEDLNQELGLKDRALADNQLLLREKEREVERLMRKINDMGASMKHLIEATASKADSEKMQEMRRKQDECQRKIDRINQVFANAPSTLTATHSKYIRRDAATVLNCVPLASPQTTEAKPLGHSGDSSRVQDDEFSIGQIGAQDNDVVPTRLA